VGVKGARRKQPTDPVIRIEGVTKNFPFGDRQEGKLFVLRGITLQVERGQIVAIVGASGAGKSTLLHIIGTLDRPSTGKVHYEDMDVFALDDDKLARFRNRQIGFVFQFHHLLPEFSALENVAMPALISGKKMFEVKKQALEYLHLVGLEERAFQKPTKLSGGEQQRVAVARALMNSPEVILADEPSGNLDTANAQVLHELIHDLSRKRGQTIVVVTHNEALAKQADRVVRIVDGVISAA
jgi:lipoprotein-releasing system ATP-binding protein